MLFSFSLFFLLLNRKHKIVFLCLTLGEDVCVSLLPRTAVYSKMLVNRCWWAVPHWNCCLRDPLTRGCNYFPGFWQDVNCDMHRAETYPKTLWRVRNLSRGKLEDVSGAPILTPSFDFVCLFLFRLLADYKVAFKKQKSLYFVITINRGF